MDYDGDGAIDLLGSPADAIGSIASYIKAFGWVPGEVPTAKVRLAPGSESDLVSGLQRVHDVSEVQIKGVVFSVWRTAERALRDRRVAHARQAVEIRGGLHQF